LRASRRRSDLERIAAAMQPADIRVEPWLWAPAVRRRRGVLPLVVVATVALAAGYGIGRVTNRTASTQTRAEVGSTTPADTTVASKTESKSSAPAEKPSLTTGDAKRSQDPAGRAEGRLTTSHAAEPRRSRAVREIATAKG
jgi:hypothetical protein